MAVSCRIGICASLDECDDDVRVGEPTRRYERSGDVLILAAERIWISAAGTGSFRVRVPGHALRDFDAPAVRQVVRYPRCAESVANRRLNSRIQRTAAHHAPGIYAQHRPARELACFSVAERSSGLLRPPAMPAAFM